MIIKYKPVRRGISFALLPTLLDNDDVIWLWFYRWVWYDGNQRSFLFRFGMDDSEPPNPFDAPVPPPPTAFKSSVTKS